MVDFHNQTFFGEDSALVFQSSSRTDPATFFKMFKKKENGSWERPSEGEGITIKFAMREIAMILEVLEHKIKSWSAKHSFKKRATIIVVEWTSDTTLKLETANYSFILKNGQIRVFQMLLQHILEEKVIYATSGEPSEKKKLESESIVSPQEKPNVSKPPKKKGAPKAKKKGKNTNGGRKELRATIEGETEKALLLNFGSEEPTWIPKSTIHSEFRDEKGIEQPFLIDTWVLKKNNVL